MSENTIIERIRSNQLSRKAYLTIRENATRIAKDPSKSTAERDNANQVLVALDVNAPAPIAREYNFMGFCPGADLSRRVDTAWRERGICVFDFWEGAQTQSQMEQFNAMLPGDWVILKKNERIGKTMKLFGFGRVRKRIATTEDKVVFEMDWNGQSHIIEVPSMGCNRTVNIRSLEKVERAMPEEFWLWLQNPF